MELKRSCLRKGSSPCFPCAKLYTKQCLAFLGRHNRRAKRERMVCEAVTARRTITALGANDWEMLAKDEKVVLTK